MVPDHQVRRKWSGDASKKVQLFKVGGSRIIGTAVRSQFCYRLNMTRDVTLRVLKYSYRPILKIQHEVDLQLSSFKALSCGDQEK